MQRFSPWWLLAWLIPLYGTPQAFSTELRLAQAPAAEAPRPLQPSIAPEAPAAAPAAPAGPPPHLALLLPLNSPSFARAADVVRQGFLVAEKNQASALPVRVYGTTDATPEILAAYRRAVEDGAALVVGPLTRSAVSALAASNGVNVPTLALNVAEGEVPVPANLHTLSLQVEAEAQQVARFAAGEGLKSAVLVSGESAIEKRMLQSFADEWSRQGGDIAMEYVFTGDTAALPALRRKINELPFTIVFLALEGPNARLVAPFLDPATPAYATSQVFSGNSSTLANYDLNGIRFLDMPWMVQPDHMAVMVYRRPDPPLAAELERLYALGIDAYRLAQALLRNPGSGELPRLDGVTGRISPARDQHFRRELVPARFRDGQAQVQEIPAGAR
ncbi:MAG: penicillin-binding protein activator [Betaproteobacteria bacterium]|nr:penicillin-binding protein activator [Betaproteobacteria bacterium]